MADAADWSDVAVKFGILVLIVVVIVVLHKHWTKKNSTQSKEKFLMGAPIRPTDTTPVSPDEIAAAEPMTEPYQRVSLNDMFTSPFPKECYPRDKVNPQDLFPSGDAANSEFAQMTPLGQGDVMNKNFLDAGHHIGIDTIGASKRNPNLSLRRDPPNPKLVVSPWNNSTIEPDLSRRPIDIGDCTM